ncbi:MAG: PD40 domain-containing protein [Phycisphaerae bacterium]|nr:PD40 domain-containing protein [Phycisphaerae bacterium]
MNIFRSIATLLIPVVFCAAAACAASGEWTEPVFRSELNDFQNGYFAAEPTASSDGLSMIFAREVPPANYQLFEARRETPAGKFTSERALVELNPQATWIKGPWLSRDGLRLYYSQAQPEGGHWASYQVIKMATRNSPTGFWETVQTLDELHIRRTADFGAVLTEDELTIIWYSRRPSPSADWRIFTASRSSVEEPFSGEREVPELKEMGAYDLHLSGDGLRVYFTAIDPGTSRPNLFTARRLSLDDAFEGGEVMGFGSPDVGAGRAWLSSDEKTIYFNSNPGGQSGIWVSYWIEDLYSVAVERIESAIAGKRELLASLTAALGDDRLALEALEELRAAGEVDPVAILQAKQDIFRSIQRQIMAIRELERSIAQLEQSLIHLQSAPRRNLPREAEKVKDKPVGQPVSKIKGK